MAVFKKQSRSTALDKRSSLRRRLQIEELEPRELLAITVNTHIDELDGSILDGDVSLRDAIAAAPAGETINFDGSLDGVTIELDDNLGELLIERDLTIDAVGLFDGVRVSATDGPNDLPGDYDGYRVFNIDDGDDLTFISVTLRGSIGILGGDVDGEGGGVLNRENLTFEEDENGGNYDGGTVFANFSSLGGGGIYSTHGLLQLEGTHVTDNQSGTAGGGVFLDAYEGGAIFTGASIYRNKVTGGGDGGGLFVSVGSEAEVIDSTISTNEADDGGGIFVGRADLTIQNSTISGNTAQSSGAGIFAGATEDALGNISISHTTIAENFASLYGGGYGGGIYAQPGFDLSGELPFFDIKNTIISGNFAAGGSDLYLGDPTYGFNYTEIGYTLIGDNTGTTLTEAPTADAFGNLIGGPVNGTIDAQLGALQNNGGRTRTHLLGGNSPAIDAGDPAAVAGVDGVPLYGQRGLGFGRVIGSGVDMGATEHPGPASADFDADGDVDGADFLAWQRGFNTPLPNATKPDGDADNDLDVDPDDLDVWELDYGSAVPIAAVSVADTPAPDLLATRAELIGAAIVLEMVGDDAMATEPLSDDLLFVMEATGGAVAATVDVAIAAPDSSKVDSPADAAEASTAANPWLSDELIEKVFG